MAELGCLMRVQSTPDVQATVISSNYTHRYFQTLFSLFSWGYRSSGVSAKKSLSPMQEIVPVHISGQAHTHFISGVALKKKLISAEGRTARRVVLVLVEAHLNV